MVEGLVIEGKGQGGFPWKKVKEFWGKVKEEYLVPIINFRANISLKHSNNISSIPIISHIDAHDVF